ncbi:FAD-linked oxidase C-terminal domain-containing protein [Acrocarpospora sp. B8E8]
MLTELTLALRPAPATSATGLAYFPDLESASDAVGGVIAAGILPATLEFLDARCVRAVEAHVRLGLDVTAGALLLFGDDGSPDEVARTLRKMAGLMPGHGATSVQVATAAAEAEALLAARRCALPALARLGGATILEDVGVPRSRLPELVHRINTIAAAHEVTIATFGHAGDGNTHPTGCFDPADLAGRERVHAAFAEVFQAAIDLGGTITGEHGVGAAKLPLPPGTARGRPDRPASPDQEDLRPGGHPQPREGHAMIFDADDLGTCISSGFCLPSRPTYQLTGDESSSPRGRIALMRAVEGGEVDLFDPAALEQGSFCLGCRACEPVCPAGVPYGSLLEDLRDAQWKGRRRPMRIRPLLAFAASERLIRLVGKVRRHARFTASETDTALMLGCFERVLFPRVSRAAATTLQGVAIPPDQGCCGALHAHNGERALGERMARRLAGRPGRIVSTAGGCSAHLAAVVGRDRVADYSEALLENGQLPGPIRIDGRRARIGLQDSCHLRNGLGVSEAPRRVISALGDHVEVPGAADCCGAAGTYSLLRRRDSRRVLAPKMVELARLKLDFLVVLNPGCQRQLTTEVRRARLRTRVLHLAELVEMARTGSR